MGDRRVRATRKDRDGDILALCNASQSWSPRGKADAIQDVGFGIHSYFVDRAGRRTDVRVVNGPTGKYWRTDSDPNSANNLDNLTDC